MVKISTLFKLAVVRPATGKSEGKNSFAQYLAFGGCNHGMEIDLQSEL